MKHPPPPPLYRVTLVVKGRIVFQADTEAFQLPQVESILSTAIRRAANDTEPGMVEVLRLEVARTQ